MADGSSQSPSPPQQRPAPEGYASWPAYWKAQDQPWRTEPEIDADRQAYLAERRAITPDSQRGIYPFRDEHGSITLTRADVEWLLLTHENRGVVGPVDWGEERQRTRKGPDLRGADMRLLNLSGLPLARLRGGLSFDEWLGANNNQREMAAIHLEWATLRGAHLEGAYLNSAHLQGADLGVIEYVEGVSFGEVVDLRGAELAGAHLKGATLRASILLGVNLQFAHLEEADLAGAHLEWANLQQAHMGGSHLGEANLEGSLLVDARLEGADLRAAFFDRATALNRARLTDPQLGSAELADVRWGDVNLAVVDWSAFTAHKARLGDEQVASRRNLTEPFQAAVRANRQLAAALRSQGMNEEADYFAYRAYVVQRVVLRRQRSGGRWLFSWFLYVASGYGFRLRRILLTYGIAVALFAVLYYATGVLLGKPEHVYAWYEAVLVSVTNMHGRIFTGLFVLDTVQAWLAAVEAVVGLVIEGVFVAMLVQRFFAR